MADPNATVPPGAPDPHATTPAVDPDGTNAGPDPNSTKPPLQDDSTAPPAADSSHGLEKTQEQTAPPRLPSDPSMPTVLGYELLEELGRGGMGVVYRARDCDLVRFLAVKLLLPKHADEEKLRRRFLEEAQIMAQLQHPGVAPLHEIGVLGDGRPYFTMKQVKGRTLSALLRDRKTPADDLTRFIGIFTQVCQTLAYAHERRIIHRDLKPENVMVGAFGEVQVMDWGLAKVLPVAPPLDADVGPEMPDVTNIHTPRSDLPDGYGTAAGSVVGTIAYMAPEQAIGKVNLVDLRSDVFGLGAILCEILTNKPPYTASNTADRHLKACRADQLELHTKLLECPADIELKDLCTRCLAPERGLRPANGGEVAAALVDYQAGVEKKLRAAEIAQVRATEERKRRRIRRAFVAVALTFLAAIAFAWMWYGNEQRIRQAQIEAQTQHINNEVNTALDDAEQHFQWVRVRLDDPVKCSELLSDIDAWQAAVEKGNQAVQRANSVSAGSETLLDFETSQRLTALQTHRGTEKECYRLGKRLDDIRSEAAVPIDSRFEPGRAGPKYEAFFVTQGFDMAHGDSGQLAAAIARSPMRFVLVATIDHWAELCTSTVYRQPKLLTRLLEVARAADPHPWRSEFRNSQVWQDNAHLATLAEDLAPHEQSPQTTVGLASALSRVGADPRSLLERALLFHPRDFWLQFKLYQSASDPVEKVLRCHALLAIRPKSTAALINLGRALYESKKLPEAIAAFNKAIEIDPKFALGYNNLGVALRDSKKLPEAIAACNKAIEIDPKLALAYNNLGLALRDSKKLPEAIAACNKAIEIDPKLALAYNNLGLALRDSKKLPEAVVAYHKAIEIDPKLALAYNNLGLALRDSKKLPEAIAACNKAIEIDPKFALGYNNLGVALRDSKKLPEAIAAYNKAIKIDPKYAVAYYNLGNALRESKKLSEAIAAYNKAIEIDPEFAAGYFGLGDALCQSKKLSEAIAAYNKAIEIDPEFAAGYFGLGEALRESKKLPEAIAAYNKAIEIDPKNAMAYNNLGNALRESKKLPEAIAAYNKAIKIDPKYAVAYYNLGNALRESKKLSEAIAAYDKAIEIDPKYAIAYNNLGLALHDSKKLPEAIAAFNRASEIDPKYAAAHYNIGNALRESKKLPEAIAAYNKAIEIDPKNAMAYNNLGNALRESKKLPEAIATYSKAIEINPNGAVAYYNLGLALFGSKKLPEAVVAFNKALEIDAKFAEAFNNLGVALRHQGEFTKSVEALKKASALGYKPAGQRIPQYERILELSKTETQKPVTFAEVHGGLQGSLTTQSTLDIGNKTLKSFRASHTVEFHAGRAYEIELVGDFDTYLRIEDAKYLEQAFNNDVTPPGNQNSRLVFTPEKDAVYRLVVTSFKPGDTGNYSLTVKEVKPANAVPPIQGELSVPGAAAAGKFFNVHKVELVAGRPYVFELDSPQFDSFLILIDTTGKQKLAENNNAGDFAQSARIDFTPKESGTYQLIVTTSQPGEIGPYTLRVQGYEPADNKKN